MMAHQIAPNAAGGKVSVRLFRDPADGTETYGAAYTPIPSRTGTDWLSPQRFPDRAYAEAAAAVLAAFWGVEVRL